MRAASVWFLAIVCIGFAGCAPRPPATLPPADLLLVTLDTFRADRAGCYGNPNGLSPALDRILRNGMIARNAYAPTPLTAPSHATIFTAHEPYEHGVRENGLFELDDTHPTLAGHLSAHGFRTAGFVGAFPLASRFGFSRGFATYDESLGDSPSANLYYPERRARVVVDSVTAFSKTVAPNDRLFLWVHFFDAHHPYRAEKPLRSWPSRSDYDREIRAVDLELDRLVKTILESGRNPLVGIVSDHGEGLGDHGELSHGILLYEETMRGVFGIGAPRDPALTEKLAPIHEPVVGYVDVAPTLLDLLAVEPIPNAEGEPLAATGPERGVYGETYYPMLHYRWSPLLSWRSERWVYIEGPDPELYDRWADPGETNDVLAGSREVAADFEARLAERTHPPAPPTGSLDAEAREKLAALGYVGTSGGAHDPSKDPKQLIGAVNSLFRGMTLVSEGNPRAALPYFQASYREDPGNSSTVFHLANCFRELGDTSTAMTYYRKAIDLDPRIPEAWSHLGLLRWERGDRDEGLRLIQEGLAQNPDAFALHMSAGELLLEVGRIQEAREHFQKAADAEPHRSEPRNALAQIAAQRGGPRETDPRRTRTTP